MSEVRIRIGGQIDTASRKWPGQRPATTSPAPTLWCFSGCRLTVFGSLSSCAKSQDHLSIFVISPPLCHFERSEKSAFFDVRDQMSEARIRIGGQIVPSASRKWPGQRPATTSSARTLCCFQVVGSLSS